MHTDDGRDGPVSHEHCAHIPGPFFHGTKADLGVGDELTAGFRSNFHTDRVMRNIYFTTDLETAVWGAELAAALGRLGGEGASIRGRIYEVEPTSTFEDDPNVTDKKFPGNPTRSYRTPHPLRVVGEVAEWDGHPPDVLQQMLDNLERMRAAGTDLIED